MVKIGCKSHLIGAAQVGSVLVQDTVGPLGLLPVLPGLDAGVAPHVGAAVRAGDVEERDPLELGTLRQRQGLPVTLSWGNNASRVYSRKNIQISPQFLNLHVSFYSCLRRSRMSHIQSTTVYFSSDC